MSSKNTDTKKQESFDVDKIPVGTRRLVRIAVLVLIMIIIFAVWVPFAIKSISENSAKGSGELSGVGKDLEIFLEGLKENAESIRDGFSENNPKNKDEIKEGVAEVLSDKLTVGWSEYTDLNNRFFIKYPAEYQFSTSSDALFQLNQIGTSTKIFEVKKFASYGNLMNMINIKKIVQRPDHLLVFFDYINNTTTNLIINSFKLIDNNL